MPKATPTQLASPWEATSAFTNTRGERGNSYERLQTEVSAEVNRPDSRAWLGTRRDDDCLVGLVGGNCAACGGIRRGRGYKCRTRRHSHENGALRPGQDGTAPSAGLQRRRLTY